MHRILCAVAVALLLGPVPVRAQALDTAVVDTAAVDSVRPAPVDPSPPPPSTLGAAARHVPLSFASDVWATVTSPLRMDGEEWLFVGGAVGAVALLAIYDDNIQRWVDAHGDDDVPATIEDVGDFLEPVSLMGNTNAYYAGGMLIGWVTGSDEIRHVFEELLYSHWIASLTRKSIGRSVGRLRPEESDDPFARQFWDGTSFPSGHSSTATQVATVLAHHIDWWPADVVLYGLAGSVVYHRVAVRKHWASDSLLGALWGYAVARIVIERREDDRTDFVPFFDPGSGAVGLRVTTATPF